MTQNSELKAISQPRMLVRADTPVRNGRVYRGTSGYIGTSERFYDAIGVFAEAYAQQTEKDWAQLVRSRKKEKPSVEK